MYEKRDNESTIWALKLLRKTRYGEEIVYFG